MRKLLLILLLSLLSNNLSAQTDDLFRLWERAIKHVGIHKYYARPDGLELSEKEDTTWSFPKYNKADYERMAKDIVREGFEFNPKNDTLLFVFTVPDLSWKPSGVYVQSSLSKQAYICKYSTEPIEFIIDKYFIEKAYPEIPMFYTSDNEKFSTLFRLFGRYGTGDGSDFVLRIVLKDGEIIAPSQMWFYHEIPYVFLSDKQKRLLEYFIRNYN